MKEFFEKMISQKRKVEMMKEEYQRIKQSLDISGINYENNGGSSGSRKADAMAEIVAEMVDFEKETARLTAEKEKLLSEIERIDKKLANEGFVAKAPAAVIEGERKKREGYADKLASVEASILKFSKK